MANFNDITSSHADAFKDSNYADQFNGISAKLTELGYEVLINDKKNAEFVPAGRFHDAVSQRDNFKQQASALNKQLEDMKKSAGDNEALQKQIQDLIDQNSSLSAAMEKANIDSEIVFEARDAVDPKDVLMFIDYNAIKTDKAGNRVGVKEEVERIRKAKPHLFNKTVAGKGGSPDGGGTDGNKAIGMNAMIRKVAGKSF